MKYCAGPQKEIYFCRVGYQNTMLALEGRTSMSDYHSKALPANRGVTLNSLKDQLYSLNMRMTCHKMQNIKLPGSQRNLYTVQQDDSLCW